MEEINFQKYNLSQSASADPQGWTESQYNQLKMQIIAYKYLIKNVSPPLEVVEKIQTYETEDWEKTKKKMIGKIQENYEKKFDNHDLNMKELAMYFKKRNKEHDNIPKLFSDRNYTEEIDYNIDYEVENRKAQIINYLNTNNNIDPENKKALELELKILKLNALQRKVRSEVMSSFLKENEKQNTIYYSDVVFQKTLLVRKYYKRQNILANKKDQKMNDRFEHQLRNGYNIRKKNKHREFLIDLMQHQRDFMDYHKRKYMALRKRSQQSRTYLENRERKGILLYYLN